MARKPFIRRHHESNSGSRRTRIWARCALIAACSIPSFGIAAERIDLARVDSAATVIESLGWIGEREDADTGLNHLNGRNYDPVLGTFLSPDDLRPDSAGVGPNRYGYGLGDPINHVDPTGHRNDCLIYRTKHPQSNNSATFDVECVTWGEYTRDNTAGGRPGGRDPWMDAGGSGTNDPWVPPSDRWPSPYDPELDPDQWPYYPPELEPRLPPKPTPDPLKPPPVVVAFGNVPADVVDESEIGRDPAPAERRPVRARPTPPIQDAIARHAQAAAAVNVASSLASAPSQPQRATSGSAVRGAMDPSDWFRTFGGPMAITISDHDRR